MLYSEFILCKLEESLDGVRVNGGIVNNIRYADDTVVTADSEGLQRLLDFVNSSNAKKSLEINIKKTKSQSCDFQDSSRSKMQTRVRRPNH